MPDASSLTGAHVEVEGSITVEAQRLLSGQDLGDLLRRQISVLAPALRPSNDRANPPGHRVAQSHSLLVLALLFAATGPTPAVVGEAFSREDLSAHRAPLQHLPHLLTIHGPGLDSRPRAPYGLIMLIGISGRARAGKDTVASLLADRMGRTKIIGFADPIKEFAGQIWLWSAEDIEERKEKPSPTVSPRQALSGIGQAVRDLDPDAWVRLGLRRARESVGSSVHQLPHPASGSGGRSGVCIIEHVIIKDVRFENESLAIKRAGGVVIHKKGGAELELPSERFALSGQAEAAADFVLGYYQDMETLRLAVDALVRGGFISQRGV